MLTLAERYNNALEAAASQEEWEAQYDIWAPHITHMASSYGPAGEREVDLKALLSFFQNHSRILGDATQMPTDLPESGHFAAFNDRSVRLYMIVNDEGFTLSLSLLDLMDEKLFYALIDVCPEFRGRCMEQARKEDQSEVTH